MALKKLTKKVGGSAKQNTPTNNEPVRPKAIRIRVDLDNGTYWLAEGANADNIFNYQKDCEQLANASGLLPSYLGPGMKLVTE